MSRLQYVSKIVSRLAAFVVGIGRIGAWMILAIMFLVIFNVAASAMRVGVMASWDSRVFLLGTDITLTDIGDMQWYIFTFMIMMIGPDALLANRHVRVDILFDRLGVRWRRIIDVVGDLCLLLPFCLAMIWFSKHSVLQAWTTGEISDYGGLNDRWLPKLAISLGFIVLALAGILRILANLLALSGIETSIATPPATHPLRVSREEE